MLLALWLSVLAGGGILSGCFAFGCFVGPWFDGASSRIRRSSYRLGWTALKVSLSCLIVLILFITLGGV